MFWGISEALDLCEEYLNQRKVKPAATESEAVSAATTTTTTTLPESLNILLFGGNDPRHVIKTMAKLYKHQDNAAGAAAAEAVCKPKLNIYMLEGCMDIVARNLMLLSIALESDESLNALAKVHLFMDIYGNALIRPASEHYLTGKAKTLMQMLTDRSVCEAIAPQLSTELLKYNERDSMEAACVFWQPRASHVFDITDYWTGRLRKLLGTRYDYRDGTFDWDLNMLLKERGCQQICSQEYRYWRETGIAFTYPEYEQCKPNKTYAVGLIRNGDYFLHRGFVGDFRSAGPFCGFGLHTSDEYMLHSVHGQNDYRATDITERNLLELFHELRTRTPYVHDQSLSRKYGSVKLQMGSILSWDEYDANTSRAYNKPWLPIDGVKLHVLSIDDIFRLQKSQHQRPSGPDSNVSDWENFFDVVFVSQNYYNLLTDTFGNILRPEGLLILETKLWTTQRRAELTDFEGRLKAFAKRCHLRPVINYNALNANYPLLRFKKSELPEDNDTTTAEAASIVSTLATTTLT